MIRFFPAVMVVGVLLVSALPALADVPIFIDNDTGRGAWITVYGGPMNDILYSTCIAPHRSWSYRFPKGWGGAQQGTSRDDYSGELPPSEACRLLKAWRQHAWHIDQGVWG